MPSVTKALAAAGLIGAAAAYPSTEFNKLPPGGSADGYGPLSDRLQSYVPPGPDDSRGPCPALNTLANHGLLPHSGKEFTSDQLLAAFPRGFGVHPSGFMVGLINFEEVCAYIKGSSCTDKNTGITTFTNLTILGEAFAFEHDHSYSRQDYKAGWAHGGIVDNIYFNSTIFSGSLDVAGYKPTNPPKAATVGFQTFQEIQLFRQAYQNLDDYPGGFVEAVPTTLFETGYIFGVTFDRDSMANQIGPDPMVRLDWWNFWFSEESFPTVLGWQPASTEHFNFDFITSVSDAILNSPVTSTPAGLPDGALATTFPFAGPLPPVDPHPTYLLFQSAPYVAPTAPASILPETRRRRSVENLDSEALAAHAHARPDLVHRASKNVAAATAAPVALDHYRNSYSAEDIQRAVDHRKNFSKKVEKEFARLIANE